MLAYLGVTILACIGYGAVFLLVGLFFRNPIIPALLLYGWEWINFLLPPFLKKISVIHYLQSLVPVPMSEGPFAVLVEPTPAWISVPSLLLFTGVVLFLAEPPHPPDGDQLCRRLSEKDMRSDEFLPRNMKLIPAHSEFAARDIFRFHHF